MYVIARDLEKFFLDLYLRVYMSWIEYFAVTWRLDQMTSRSTFQPQPLCDSVKQL